jgi:CubicO group peptidase (beta-lactamase class C family)
MRFAVAAVASLMLGCATGGGMKDVDALMRDYSGNVPGASLLVVKDGRAVVRRSYGLADLEAQRAATPQTNYRLASVTKQFTAAAIMQLVEEGQLRYDDPLRRWLPSLPAESWSDSITIRHLLTHTSGLVDYEDVMPEHVDKQLLDADVLRLLEAQKEMYFEPGSQYRYSNSGYALLALVVERASGQSFASFLRERIFAPLGMSETVAFEDGRSTVAHRAYGYTREGDGWKRTDQSSTSAVLGDGGIYSSIDDLAKWDAALYDTRYEPAFTPATPTDDPNLQYGFGWRIGKYEGARMLTHSGETIGFRNVIVRVPERKLTVVVLTNRNAPPPFELATRIAALY